MQKTSLFSFAAACALILLNLPSTGRAGMITLNGDNTNSPVFNRTTQSGAASFQSPHFDAYLLTVNLNGAYNFTMVASDPTFFDTYIHLYQGSFNPADPEANFLSGNDDGPGGADAGSALSAIPLIAGTSYYLVADGFSALDYGAYTATIQGPGNIIAMQVPEPSSVMFAALGMAFVGWLLRRKRRGGVMNTER